MEVTTVYTGETVFAAHDLVQFQPRLGRLIDHSQSERIHAEFRQLEGSMITAHRILNHNVTMLDAFGCPWFRLRGDEFPIRGRICSEEEKQQNRFKSSHRTCRSKLESPDLCAARPTPD